MYWYILLVAILFFIIIIYKKNREHLKPGMDQLFIPGLPEASRFSCNKVLPNYIQDTIGYKTPYCMPPIKYAMLPSYYIPQIQYAVDYKLGYKK